MRQGAFPSIARKVRQSFFLLFAFVVASAFAAQDKTGDAADNPGWIQEIFPRLQKEKPLTELSLDKLLELEIPDVVGASKFKQKTTEAPSSVSVVSAEEIKRYGYRTLADLLQSMNGLYVTYDRNYSFLGVRGINLGDFNSRVLVLVDGHRINNNLTDGANIGTAFILDADLIDRVEIIRGPGSVLYGNNAFFGVINVITREGGQLSGAEASGEYGEFDTWKGRFSYGNKFKNDLELVLSGTLYDSDGNDRLFYRQFKDQNNGIARNVDGDSFGSFFGKLAWHDFSLEGALVNREKENPTAQFLTTFNDDRLRTTDEQSFVNLKYAHNFPEIVDVIAQVYYDRSDFEIGYPVEPMFFKERQAGEGWGAELQLNKHLWERHILTLGAEFRDDFHQHRRVFDANSGATATDTDKERRNLGFYFQGEFTIVTNMLHFNAGVRYDQYDDFNQTSNGTASAASKKTDSVNPRLALIYDPFPKTTFKAIYGTAFRSPNFLELALSQPGKLGPEEITTYELVYEQGIGDHLRSSVSGFYNEIDDLIALTNGAFYNFDAKARGVEMQLEGFWTNGVRARASYTFADAENRSGGGSLPDSPRHLAKANLSVPIWQDKISAGLEFLYVSRRNTSFTDSTGKTLEGRDVSGYGILNFTLFSQNLVKNLELSASVYNLLDHGYGHPATRFHKQDIIKQDGRTFRIKLTYRY